MSMTARVLVVGALVGAALVLTLGALGDELVPGDPGSLSFGGCDELDCRLSVADTAQWKDKGAADVVGTIAPAGVVTLRVPRAKLEAILTDLAASGCVESDTRPPLMPSKLALPAPCGAP